MAIVAGVDIGNSTTEVCLAAMDSVKVTNFYASSIVKTTGIKGTLANIPGIVIALEESLKKAGMTITDLSEIRLNEATPVIGDLAMETITETIITESTMIGHNPSTPGGVGLGVGQTVSFSQLASIASGEKVICVIPENIDFEDAARILNQAIARGIDLQGVIVRQDDAVLIANRLQKIIPVVDEVTLIEKVPIGMLAAVEVAEPGQTIKTLSNPYGIATVFELSAGDTKMVVPIARALIGNRSAVVVRTPQGDVKARTIPAGFITVIGAKGRSWR